MLHEEKKQNAKRNTNDMKSIHFNLKQCSTYTWITGDNNVIWIEINLLITLNRVLILMPNAHAFQVERKQAISSSFGVCVCVCVCKPIVGTKLNGNGANEFRTKADQTHTTAHSHQETMCTWKYEWIDRLWQVKYLVYLFHRCDNPSYLNHNG